MLTKSIVLLKDVIEHKATVSFYPDDSVASVRHLAITRQTWLDMGKPSEITVTIQPGDQLNEAEPSDG